MYAVVHCIASSRESPSLVVQLDRDDVGVDRLERFRADQVRHIVDDAAVIPVGDLLDLRRGGDRVTVVAIVGVALALGADDDIGVEGVRSTSSATTTASGARR